MSVWDKLRENNPAFQLFLMATVEPFRLCWAHRGGEHAARVDWHGKLVGHRGPVEPKLFTYLRYNAELTREGLATLGLPQIKPQDVQQMDSVDHVLELQQVGAAVAQRQVDTQHFAKFL